MALVTGKCLQCGYVIQMEGTEKSGFCTFCGIRLSVEKAVERYNQELGKSDSVKAAESPKVPSKDATLSEAQGALSSSHFELAVKLFGEVLAGDQENTQARWGTILAKTKNLTPMVIRNTDDYALSDANALFAKGVTGVEPAWRGQYWDAFDESCRMSVESVDPRVFLELRIYQWYPQSNTFLYPISKDFNIQPILDKELWADWNKMLEALPEEKREALRELCNNCCRRIREYFLSGFANMEELQNGDLSRLMGTWHLKRTTGVVKTEVLSFSQNPVGVPHLETFRTSVNGYDYYRYIKVDPNNRITAEEHRHFPSSAGIGGDFARPGSDTHIFGLMAVYEYVLILPTALYQRAEPNNIPGFGRAQVFTEKCRTTPCFIRSENLKHVYQIRPIADNHETGEQSKKMSNCYIATAVYGGIEAPEVRRLRRWRDETLNKSRFGRRVCALYYKFSPRLARKLSPSGAASRAVRRVLDMFVKRLGD
jgi:hypothetical protein